MLGFMNPLTPMTFRLLPGSLPFFNLVLFIAFSFAASTASLSAQSLSPGEIEVQPATLASLGFRLEVSGDGERNGTVEVTFRKAGESQWNSSLPLYRVSNDAFVGSVLDLEPGTEYEVAFKISDPDGVEGDAVRQLTTATRAVPQPYRGGRILHVYPPDHKGPKAEPHYKSLMHAIHGRNPGADDVTWTKDHVRPGDTIFMHAGTYKSDWKNYRESIALWHEGTHEIPWDGEPDKPITVMAAGDGEVIIDGANRNGEPAHILFDVMGADYWTFKGLTLRNATIAFKAGQRGITGAKGLAVMNCRMENVSNGVLGLDGRCEGFVISDNTIIGTNATDRFHPEGGSAAGRSDAGYGVKLIGSGHTVCYNRVEAFWDGINVSTNAMAEPEFGLQAYAIDFYNNDIFNILDNFIEADGGLWNIRIQRNRCFNSKAAPLSIQPVYQGPVYWIDNVVYNGHPKNSFKLLGADAMVAYHNTIFGYFGMARANFLDLRNNVFRGTVEEDSRPNRKITALNLSGLPGEGHLIDYNAYGADLPGDIFITPNKQGFSSLNAFAAVTGYERHGIEILGADAFAQADAPPFPERENDLLISADSVDLRPASGSPLIDAGVVIPGLRREYSGSAPDIGAYEYGMETPHYGPRE